MLAFHTCEIAKKWGVTQLSKAGSMGVLSNFHLLSPVQPVGPRINECREYRYTTRINQESENFLSSHSRHDVCVEFLPALHRLQKDVWELNGQRSVLSSTGRRQSCALLSLKQPWLQALLRSISGHPEKNCVETPVDRTVVTELPVTKEREKKSMRSSSDGGVEGEQSKRVEV